MNPKISFTLDRLFSDRMDFDFQEFYVKHNTAIHWDRYKNYLCLDVYTQVTNIIVLISNKLRLEKCKKVLIDCFNDFGQFGSSDSPTTEKPFSTYAKFLDSCELSTEQAFTLQTYEPFLTTQGYSFRWVGDGNFDKGCWPGQLDYWWYYMELLIMGGTPA